MTPSTYDPHAPYGDDPEEQPPGWHADAEARALEQRRVDHEDRLLRAVALGIVEAFIESARPEGGDDGHLF